MTRRGFTLIEVIVTIGILVLILGMAGTELRQAMLLHRRAADCSDDVEASLRLSRDLRKDLFLARELTATSDGRLCIRLKEGTVDYAQEALGVARCRADGGRRLYRGLREWTASANGTLDKASWELSPRGGRGVPPRYEVAMARRVVP